MWVMAHLSDILTIMSKSGVLKNWVVYFLQNRIHDHHHHHHKWAYVVARPLSKTRIFTVNMANIVTSNDAAAAPTDPEVAFRGKRGSNRVRRAKCIYIKPNLHSSFVF